MDSLYVVWVIVSPCPSHAFATFVVGTDIVIVCELLFADCANSFLLGDLPIEQFAHLSPGPQLSISPWVMWILDALNTQPDQLGFQHEFPATAGNGLVDRTDFVGTEPHGSSPHWPN